MEKVRKRRRHQHYRLWRWLLPLSAVCAALALFAGWHVREDSEKTEVIQRILTAGTIEERETEQVLSIEVTLDSGDHWLARQETAGALVTDDGRAVSANMTRTFLSEAAVIGYEDILSEHADAWKDRKEEFGLDPAKSTVEVTYTDGSAITLYIGDRISLEEMPYVYMAVEGQDNLYAISVSTADDWKLSSSALYPVSQPNLHTARMDHLIFRWADGETAEWMLEEEITSATASDAWVLSSPVRYPADGTEMTTFLGQIGNLRLGSYVGEATEENLEAFGFTPPSMEMIFHMAEGMTAVTGDDGAVTTQVLPEETVHLALGDNKNEYVRYVLYDGAIYVSSELTLGVVTGKDPLSTLSRYPVPVGSDTLRRLVVENVLTGKTTEYRIEREETEDDEGQSVTETRCIEISEGSTEEISFDTFEARYMRAVLCTVSGTLPEDAEIGEAEIRYLFETISGKTHTLVLYAFDAMHQAVGLDNYPVIFYLIRGGLGI